MRPAGRSRVTSARMGSSVCGRASAAPRQTCEWSRPHRQSFFEDLLITGSAVGEGPGRAAPGHIRAYDVRTGEQRWVFHTIPHPGEVGHETWPPEAWKKAGGANSWGGFSLDRDRGILYAPTGSAPYDHFGGDRHDDNLFANSIIALDARSGRRIWHFQTVHHDLWDYDVPTPPNLVTIRKDGNSSTP